MAKQSKGYKKMSDVLEKGKSYDVKDALQLLKDNTRVKFDETVEMTFRLGVDPRKSDQMVRGVVSLPHGTGKTIKVLVLTGDAKKAEAEEAGADFVGDDDIVAKIQKGWTDFDVIIATPDMMKKMGKLGRILGPRGLMPSPKAGTVTQNVGQAVKDVKKGKIEFKVDKTGNLHVGIGKISFDVNKLCDNALAVAGAIAKARPKTSKGTYLIKAYLSSTMGPGLELVKDSIKVK